MRNKFLIFYAAVMMSIAHAQTGPASQVQDAKSLWQTMLRAKYGGTERPAKFAVVERARFSEMLAYAYAEGQGWWICFDDRPLLSAARVEVQDLTSGKAHFSWIMHGPEPSRPVTKDTTLEQRTMTLAIFDPGAPELKAIPTSVSKQSDGRDSLTVRAGEEILRYDLDPVTHMPARIEIRVPYHPFLPSSPKLGPDATIATVVETRKYRQFGTVFQPSSILLQGDKYSVEYHPNPEFPEGLFQLPIAPAFQKPDAWRIGTVYKQAP